MNFFSGSALWAVLWGGGIALFGSCLFCWVVPWFDSIFLGTEQIFRQAFCVCSAVWASALSLGSAFWALFQKNATPKKKHGLQVGGFNSLSPKKGGGEGKEENLT